MKVFVSYRYGDTIILDGIYLHVFHCAKHNLQILPSNPLKNNPISAEVLLIDSEALFTYVRKYVL